MPFPSPPPRLDCPLPSPLSDISVDDDDDDDDDDDGDSDDHSTLPIAQPTGVFGKTVASKPERVATRPIIVFDNLNYSFPKAEEIF